MLPKKRILITGATGFIGAFLLDEARRLGWEIWVALRPSSQPDKLTGQGVHTIVLDYADEEGMLQVFASIPRESEDAPLWDYVIHNAGLTKTPDPKEFFEANAENTLRLCRALKTSMGVGECFLLMSSMSVYGIPQGEDHTLRATDTPQPTTEYGKSKLLAERYVAESGLPYTILQPTGVYGVGDRDYLMAIEAIAGGVNMMAGISPQYLTFVYGEDVARATYLLLQDPRARGERYIVSDGDTYTDREFGGMVQGLLGRKRVWHLRVPLLLVWCICRIGSFWGKLTGRITPLNTDKYHLMAQRSWRCDISPLRSLGYEPRYTLEEGLKLTIAWMLRQPK